jgi:hypothetical protein
MNPLISDLAVSIQLAVAPVFLLAGIAGFLNVMSGRLGRIIDRARIIERQIARIVEDKDMLASNKELKILWHRVTLTNWAIGLCTTSALLVCVLITGLFIGGFWGLHLEMFTVICFVAALLVLNAALVLFLKEIQLATRSLRLGSEGMFDHPGN